MTDNFKLTIQLENLFVWECDQGTYFARYRFAIVIQQILFLFSIFSFNFGQFTRLTVIEQDVNIGRLTKAKEILF